MFTKDYVLIANVIKQTPEVKENVNFIKILCIELKKNNPRFETEKFINFLNKAPGWLNDTVCSDCEYLINEHCPECGSCSYAYDGYCNNENKCEKAS